jgi:hypothetical protein
MEMRNPAVFMKERCLLRFRNACVGYGGQGIATITEREKAVVERSA